MEVRPVDNRTHFTGYVDKSLVKFINKEMKAKCYKMAEDAAVYGKTVAPEEIVKVKQLGSGILDKFSKFASGLHEKTAIAHSSMPQGMRTDIFMENPVSDRLVTLASTNQVTEYSLTMHSMPGENLEILNVVADRLLRRNPQEINRSFLSHGETELSHMYDDNDFIQRFLLKKKAKSLDNYAKEIGDTKTNHLDVLEKRFSSELAIEKKKAGLVKKSQALINKIIGGKS